MNFLPPAPVSPLHAFPRLLSGLKLLAVSRLLDCDSSFTLEFIRWGILLCCAEMKAGNGVTPNYMSPLQPGEPEIRDLAIKDGVDIEAMLSHLKG